jgi:hypothetical protein
MALEPDAAPRPPSSPFRLRDGGIATLFLIAALLILLGITRTDVIAYAQQVDLFYITAMLIALAVPGPIIRLWDLPGQLWLWNAAGWCLGLVIFGMASFGATPMLPLILIAFALTFWPREDGAPLPWTGASIGLVGGFLICWALWDNAYADIPLISI